LDAASLACQFAASVLTIISSWLYGSKRVWGPVLGVCAQVPWWTLMVHMDLWGLLPLNVTMLVIHVRNTWKWWRA
jgi:hypothetical protein